MVKWKKLIPVKPLIVIIVVLELQERESAWQHQNGDKNAPPPSLHSSAPPPSLHSSEHSEQQQPYKGKKLNMMEEEHRKMHVASDYFKMMRERGEGGYVSSPQGPDRAQYSPAVRGPEQHNQYQGIVHFSTGIYVLAFRISIKSKTREETSGLNVAKNRKEFPGGMGVKNMIFVTKYIIFFLLNITFLRKLFISYYL